LQGFAFDREIERKIGAVSVKETHSEGWMKSCQVSTRLAVDGFNRRRAFPISRRPPRPSATALVEAIT
jgi:hypothetical protein